MKLEERNIIIEKYMPFARSQAVKKHKTIQSIDVDELKSAAYLGLVEAADRFDPSRSNFPSYAKYRIAGEIQDYLRGLGFGSRSQKKFVSLDEMIL